MVSHQPIIIMHVLTVYLVNDIEYGRATEWTQGEAKERAAAIAYSALYHQLYGRYP